jgi:peptidoglycan/xylan/chitin deacetylase (PgdA/CDA1 family)
VVRRVKRELKRAAEQMAASLAPLTWSMQRAPRLVVLMYHRVLPLTHPDRATEQPGMYVSPKTLDMHLGLLRAHGFDLVHLDDWLREGAQSRSARSCAITFDDGWRDNYDHAYPILKRWNAPATIYLVSDMVGTNYSFWPNLLARLLGRCDEALLARMPSWLRAIVANETGGSVPRALEVGQIDRIIGACKSGRTDGELLAALRELADTNERDLMSWAEIEEMKASGLVRFGSHTRRHTRLSKVSSAADLRDEIVGSADSIAQRLGVRPVTFCYPNGDTSTEAVATVRTAYQAAVTTRRGWHTTEDDPFVIRRIGLHEDVSDRPAAFIARISGWL